MRRGALLEARFVDPVLNVARHSLAGSFKDSGLIHVIPEAGHTIRYKLLVKGTPPFPGGGLREIRKDGWAWPDWRHVNGTVRVFDELIAGGAGVVGSVAYVGLVGDVQVSNDDHLEVFFGHVFDQARKV